MYNKPLPFCTKRVNFFNYKNAHCILRTGQLQRQDTGCPISLGPHEKSVIWQNTEKCKEGEVVANHVFLISSVRTFLPRTNCYGAAIFTLSIVKIRRCCHIDMTEKGDVFPDFPVVLCLVHYRFPLLWKHSPFRWQVNVATSP
jgi:hypothetical protein